MGREIRKVPAGWEHPRDVLGNHRPLRDRCYRVALQNWEQEKAIFDAIGPSILKSILKHDASSELHEEEVEYQGKKYIVYKDEKAAGISFEEWHGSKPDPDYYRPDWTEEERTHFQMYETVTEGTPLSPVFASLAQLEDWLVTIGTSWDGPMSRDVARNFCANGWAPTFVVSDSKVFKGPEGMAIIDKAIPEK